MPGIDPPFNTAEILQGPAQTMSRCESCERSKLLPPAVAADCQDFAL